MNTDTNTHSGGRGTWSGPTRSWATACRASRATPTPRARRTFSPLCNRASRPGTPRYTGQHRLIRGSSTPHSPLRVLVAELGELFLGVRVPVVFRVDLAGLFLGRDLPVGAGRYCEPVGSRGRGCNGERGTEKGLRHPECGERGKSQRLIE